MPIKHRKAADPDLNLCGAAADLLGEIESGVVGGGGGGPSLGEEKVTRKISNGEK